MDIEERVEIAILMKYYAKLLTDKQRDILDMYIDNNLSLKEVSEELNISRQAVKDALDNSYHTLRTTEEKLGFIARDNKLKQTLEDKPLNQIDMATRLEIITILEDN